MAYRILKPLACLALAFFVGCSSATESPTSSAGQGTSPTEEAIVDSTSGEPSEYLATPEGIPKVWAEQYTSLLDQAQEPESALELARASQAIGMQLAQAGDEKGYEFLVQSAKLMRLATDSGISVPIDEFANALYNEACGLAVGGDSKAAFDSLKDAVEKGFSDLELVKKDTDLESVRALDGFDEMLAEMEVVAAEWAMKKVKEELANGESFPFEFALTDIAGEEQSLEKHLGKVMIVDVWGTWCPPCRAEIPSFVKLQQEYGDKGFQMIGLNYERGGSEEKNLELVENYVAQEGINYPCVMGTSEVKDQIPSFRGFPTTLFIDKTGKVRLKAVGLHEYSYLKSVVETLLAEEPAS